MRVRAGLPLAAIPTVPATDPVPAGFGGGINGVGGHDGFSGAHGWPTGVAGTADASGLPADPNAAASSTAAAPATLRSAQATGATRTAAARNASPVPPRTLTARFVTALATLMFLSIAATEGVAWLSAEHFRRTIPDIDERNVIASREAYDAVASWSLFDLGLRLRVDRPLVEALRGVGDRVITDYRREVPSMGAEEWRHAQAAFSWARSLSHGDASLRAKELIAEGHVRRIAAQRAKSSSAATSNAQAAVVRFRDAAAADPSSYDPYIGMAVPLVYTLGDVDAGIAAIDEAVKRGFVATRREKALLGDAYMRRAATSVKRAGELSGDERHRTLVKARGDYEHCVSSFAEIVNFGKATENLNACKAQIRKIDQQLDWTDRWLGWTGLWP
jgi:hypothetical protein